jgi:hypothetical protein
MTTKFISLTPTEWQEQFKPIYNPASLAKYADSKDVNFETYGDDLELVKENVDKNLVWTFSDGDMCSFISNGYHYVNRLNYYICSVPYDEDTEYEVIVSTEEECECYSEDEEILAKRNDEWGDPDCKECEGAGYVTNYVG